MRHGVRRRLATRVAAAIRRYGMDVVVWSQSTPIVAGTPQNTTYTQAGSTQCMIQFGEAAQDAAARIGALDRQAALGYWQAADADLVQDGSYVLDAKGRVWKIRSLPDAQALDDFVGVKCLLIRDVKPPAEIA